MSDDIQEAIVVAEKIAAKVEATLDPLVREMKLMGWRPEYQAIMLEALARRAIALASEAQREVQHG